MAEITKPALDFGVGSRFLPSFLPRADGLRRIGIVDAWHKVITRRDVPLIRKHVLAWFAVWEVRGPRFETLYKGRRHGNHAPRPGGGLALPYRDGLRDEVCLIPAQQPHFREPHASIQSDRNGNRQRPRATGGACAQQRRFLVWRDCSTHSTSYGQHLHIRPN